MPHLHQRTDHPNRKSLGETQALNDTLDQMDSINMYRTFHLKAAEYTQVHMEHSPGLIICWATKQALVNLRRLKLHQASFQTTTL